MRCLKMYGGPDKYSSSKTQDNYASLIVLSFSFWNKPQIVKEFFR